MCKYLLKEEEVKVKNIKQQESENDVLAKNYALFLRSRDWGQPTSFLHRRASQNVRWIQQNAELFGTRSCPFIWVVNGLIDVALDDDCRNIYLLFKQC